MIRYLSGRTPSDRAILMNDSIRAAPSRDVARSWTPILPAQDGGSYGLPIIYLRRSFFTVGEMYALTLLCVRSTISRPPSGCGVCGRICAPLTGHPAYRGYFFMICNEAREWVHVCRIILQFAVKEQPYYVIYYQKKNCARYTVQFSIRAAYGRGMGRFRSGQARVFQCDRITAEVEN